MVGWIFSGSFAHANLIVNGSFEQTDVRENSWRWFTADRVDGWQGSNIEIWDSFQKFDAFDGGQLAELNAHGQGNQPFSIFQSFDTEIGREYQVSFAYSARRNENEAFRFELLTPTMENLMSVVLDDHQVRSWTEFTTSFVATSLETIIQFTALTRGTVGNFIDDISVLAAPQKAEVQSPADRVSVTSVNEPGTLLLMAVAMAFVVIRLRNSGV